MTLGCRSDPKKEDDKHSCVIGRVELFPYTFVPTGLLAPEKSRETRGS